MFNCSSLYLGRSWQYMYKQASFSQWLITGNSNVYGYCDYCCVTKYLKKFFSLYSQKLGIKNLGWTQLGTSAGHSWVTHVPITTSKLSRVGWSKMTSLICVAVGTVCQLGLSVWSLTSTCSAWPFSRKSSQEQEKETINHQGYSIFSLCNIC